MAFTISFSLLQIAHAQTQEPGYEQSKEAGKIPELPKEWAHPTTEVRGVWIPRDSLEAQPNETKDHLRTRLAQTLDKLKAANFNLLLLDCWFKGFVAYPGSAIAPQYPPFVDNDLVGFMIDGAHKRGMQAQAWLGYGFYAYYTPDAIKDKSMGSILDTEPGLAAIDSNGKRVLHRTIGDYYSLCPSNPRSHEILGNMLLEILKKYPVDGIHLDRIRYPEENYCFCDYCKEHFKRDTGLDLAVFAKGSPEAQKFLDWRREQTAKAVAHFYKVIQAKRPGLPITAYVLSPTEMDSKAQGWDLWAKRGYVDALAVSMYGVDIQTPAKRAIELLGGSSDKLMCAISCEHPSNIYLANINVARSLTSVGQITWWLGKLDPDYEALESGPYSQPAESPFKASAR